MTQEVKQPHTLEEALLKRQSAKEELEAVEKKYQKQKEELESSYQELNQLVEEFMKPNNIVATQGSTYIKYADANNSYIMEILVDFTLRMIDKGELRNLIDNNQNVSYWYNSGFESGHARVITNGYGEDNASNRGTIALSTDLYNHTIELTDEIILSIRNYLASIKEDLNTLTLNGAIEATSKTSGKTYRIFKYADGTATLIKSYILNTSVPDKETKLNNWLLKFYDLTYGAN